MDEVGMFGLKIGRPAELDEGEEEDPRITAAAAARAAQMAVANAAKGVRPGNLGNVINVRRRGAAAAAAGAAGRYHVEPNMLSPNNNPNEIEEVNVWEVPLGLPELRTKTVLMNKNEIYANTGERVRQPLTLEQQANVSVFNSPKTPNPASVKSTKKNEPPKLPRRYRKTRRSRRNRRSRRYRR